LDRSASAEAQLYRFRNAEVLDDVEISGRIKVYENCRIRGNLKLHSDEDEDFLGNETFPDYLEERDDF